MLRKFRISIDGKEYLVEMEEIDRNTGETVQQQVTAPAQQQPTPVAEEASSIAQSSPIKDPEAMGAPMPGTVLKILVAVGETVTENQPLLILEAMKMENEIVANQDGVISAIHIKNGEMVDVGAPLVTISD